MHFCHVHINKTILVRQGSGNFTITYCSFADRFSLRWPSAWRRCRSSCHRPSVIFRWLPSTKVCWMGLRCSVSMSPRNDWRAFCNLLRLSRKPTCSLLNYTYGGWNTLFSPHRPVKPGRLFSHGKYNFCISVWDSEQKNVFPVCSNELHNDLVISLPQVCSRDLSFGAIWQTPRADDTRWSSACWWMDASVSCPACRRFIQF